MWVLGLHRATARPDGPDHAPARSVTDARAPVASARLWPPQRCRRRRRRRRPLVACRLVPCRAASAESGAPTIFDKIISKQIPAQVRFASRGGCSPPAATLPPPARARCMAVSRLPHGTPGPRSPPPTDPFPKPLTLPAGHLRGRAGAGVPGHQPAGARPLPGALRLHSFACLHSCAGVAAGRLRSRSLGGLVQPRPRPGTRAAFNRRVHVGPPAAHMPQVIPKVRGNLTQLSKASEADKPLLGHLMYVAAQVRAFAEPGLACPTTRPTSARAGGSRARCCGVGWQGEGGRAGVAAAASSLMPTRWPRALRHDMLAWHTRPPSLWPAPGGQAGGPVPGLPRGGQRRP